MKMEDIILPEKEDLDPMANLVTGKGSNHHQGPPVAPKTAETEKVHLLREENRVLFLNLRALLWKSGINRPDVADSVFLTLSGDGIRYPFTTGTPR